MYPIQIRATRARRLPLRRRFRPAILRNPYNRRQNPKKWDIWMRDHGFFGGWSDWGNRPHPSN